MAAHRRVIDQGMRHLLNVTKRPIGDIQPELPPTLIILHENRTALEALGSAQMR